MVQTFHIFHMVHTFHILHMVHMVHMFHCLIQLSWCTQRTGLTAQGDVEVSAVSKDTELKTDTKLTSEDLSATVQASCCTTIDNAAAIQDKGCHYMPLCYWIVNVIA